MLGSQLNPIVKTVLNFSCGVVWQYIAGYQREIMNLLYAQLLDIIWLVGSALGTRDSLTIFWAASPEKKDKDRSTKSKVVASVGGGGGFIQFLAALSCLGRFGRKLINFAPQTDKTTCAFASVYILLLLLLWANRTKAKIVGILLPDTPSTRTYASKTNLYCPVSRTTFLALDLYQKNETEKQNQVSVFEFLGYIYTSTYSMYNLVQYIRWAIFLEYFCWC